MNTNTGDTHFRRKIGCERAMVMLPFNVVLVGRVRGAVDPSQVSAALENLRLRHPLLSVRVEMDTDTNAWLTNESVHAIETTVENRQKDEQWLDCVQKEIRTPFPIEKGPMVRCTIVHSNEVSDILLCGHHVVCDGMSLGYLLRDLLNQLGGTFLEETEPLIPPAVDSSNVPSPPKVNWLMRFIMAAINKKWSSKNIALSSTDRQKMHKNFWESNDGLHLQAWSMDLDDTHKLVDRCHTEKVTVNSVLWTAFLAAQHDVQKDTQAYRERSALAVNIRDKLLSPAGESFGFFASSLTLKLHYEPTLSFWENARSVHEKITRELDKTNLFRSLISELINPTLLDSLYFQKYNQINETISKKILRKMNWHRMTYGYALTNVGRLDIPTSYGSLELEEVYGPLFYSDVEEKMIGVITVGGHLSFLQASNESIAPVAEQLKKVAMKYIDKAIQTSC